MDSFSRAYPQRPQYPFADSSASSSAFQSSSSLASVSSVSSRPGMPSSSSSQQYQQQAPFARQQFFQQQPQTAGFPSPTASAPLPSPSNQTTAGDQYFATFRPQAQSATSHPVLPQVQQRAPQQSQGQAQAAMPHRNTTNGPETTGHLQDFSLIAEAAKRAQMACLMRDFGDVEL